RRSPRGSPSGSRHDGHSAWRRSSSIVALVAMWGGAVGRGCRPGWREVAAPRSGGLAVAEALEDLKDLAPGWGHPPTVPLVLLHRLHEFQLGRRAEGVARRRLVAPHPGIPRGAGRPGVPWPRAAPVGVRFGRDGIPAGAGEGDSGGLLQGDPPRSG